MRLTIASMLFGAGVFGQTAATNAPIPATGSPSAPNASTVSPREAQVSIEIETSRAQLTAGEGIGVAAEITNGSADQSILVKETSVTLTVPPEMSGANDTRTWFAYFPTEHPPQAIKTDVKTEEFAELVLQPKNTYQVFWTPIDARPHTMKPDASVLSRIATQLNNVMEQVATDLGFLFFTPGDYKLTAQVKYWIMPVTMDKNSTYRTVQKSTVVHIAAPQLVIIIGAILGGLIAYFVLPRSTRDEQKTVTTVESGTKIEAFFVRVARRTYGLFGVCLLSAIVTILLARISETQFLVKVTVNDVWGAITIGFFANYVGSKILERFFPQSERRGTVIGQGGATQTHIETHDTTDRAEESNSTHSETLFEPKPET
jgi:hypothetical protein